MVRVDVFSDFNLMTDQWTKIQSRDVDWSKDEKPVKFGDDAVAEENYRCLLFAPPNDPWTWKKPNLPIFYLIEQ